MKYIWAIVLIVLGLCFLLAVFGLIQDHDGKFKQTSKRRKIGAGSVFAVIGVLGLLGGVSIWPRNPHPKVPIVAPPAPSPTTPTPSKKNIVTSHKKPIAKKKPSTNGETRNQNGMLVADKPYSKQQLLSIVNWANDQYNQVYNSLQGFQPGDPADPQFESLEGQVAQALSAKGDSIPGPKNGYGTDFTWWSIQGDVDQVTNFALDAVSTMALYENGNVSNSELQQHISEYQQQYNVTVKEIQTGQWIEK